MLTIKQKMSDLFFQDAKIINMNQKTISKRYLMMGILQEDIQFDINVDRFPLNLPFNFKYDIL